MLYIIMSHYITDKKCNTDALSDVLTAQVTLSLALLANHLYRREATTRLVSITAYRSLSEYG